MLIKPRDFGLNSISLKEFLSLSACAKEGKLHLESRRYILYYMQLATENQINDRYNTILIWPSLL